MTKVLIVRFSSIGDIVLTSPVVRNLKEQMHGGVEIHYLTKKAFRTLVDTNPHIDKVIAIERSTNEVMDELKAEGYDYIFDLHSNFRSARVKRALKVLSFTFKKYNMEKWLLVNLGINRMPKKHIVDRYMDTLKAFKIHNDGKGLDFFFPEVYAFPESDIPATHHNGYVAVVIGAAHWRKKPTVDQYVKICNDLQYPVVLLGGPSEMGESAEIDARSPGALINAVGRYDLYGSAWLIKHSRLVITPDTGMMHIAAAFKKPIISLWAATVPEFGMGPYMNGDFNAILQPDHLKRRPCSKLGTRCKYSTCRCVDELPIATAVSLARAQLAEN